MVQHVDLDIAPECQPVHILKKKHLMSTHTHAR